MEEQDFDENVIPLTEGMIIQASKVDSLDKVKSINFWGRSISDVSVLNKLNNVEIVSLSINRIRSLKDFRQCRNLKELYLRKNLISDYHEIDHLIGLNNLVTLWLEENPCSQMPLCTEYIITKLPKLTHLDKKEITNEDRRKAMKMLVQMKVDNAGKPTNIVSPSPDRIRVNEKPKNEIQSFPMVSVQQPVKSGNKDIEYRQPSPRPNSQPQSNAREIDSEIIRARELEKEIERQRQREKEKEHERERERERERIIDHEKQSNPVPINGIVQRKVNAIGDGRDEQQLYQRERDRAREREREFQENERSRNDHGRDNVEHALQRPMSAYQPQRNVNSSHALYAILALLKDLTDEETRIVEEEIQQLRIRKLKEVSSARDREREWDRARRG
ncbi:MAG: putative leucine rich repeat family protein [Streblomastix strix]|uniref:Putative leucine rich repeat family protein n=1 Tax=Streblomastix strix TaxID=222440 RepID=A0A5J4UWU9_9EUKA|nr:MAG: putative leucine rich repeat family protein [Streblomastix strix]